MRKPWPMIACGFVASVFAVDGWLLVRISRVQIERDAARAIAAAQREEIQQLQTTIAAQRENIVYFQQQLAGVPTASSNQSNQQGVISASTLEVVGNLIRPGLGTAAAKLSDAAKTPAQAGECAPGSRPETSPYWQGYKCVAVDPHGEN